MGNRLINICIALFAGFNLFAQHPPPVDWEKLPVTAYEPGFIQIKLTPLAFNALPAGQLPLSGDNGFGLPALDSVWQQLGFARYQKVVTVPISSFKVPALPAQTDVLRWVRIKLNNPKMLGHALEALASLKEWVEMAEPLYKIELYRVEQPFETEWIPNDTLFNAQWHYKNTGQSGGTPGADISMTQAWELEKGNPAVIVGIMDNGIDTAHPDLRPNLWAGRGYNFFQAQPGLVPGNHGNHVTGIVGAASNNTAYVAGVAGGDGTPQSGIRLMSLQTFGASTGSGGFEDAFVWSAINGAAIVNNSWGYTNPDVFNQSVLDAIDYFIANGGGGVLHNGLVIFSGGNGGDYAQRWPGAFHKVIGVTATNHNDKKAWYGTYHENIDISAPGGELNEFSGGPLVNGGRQGILSTVVSSSGFVGYLQGTSMATPQVTGVAALVVSSAMGRLSADDVKSLILNNADPIDAFQNAGERGRVGTGRLNAFETVKAAVAQMALPVVAAPTSFTGVTSCDNAILQWNNSGSGDVVLAVSTHFERGGLFGIPTGMLQAGDTIPGGGKVIYKGPANGFTYAGMLQNTTYFFKIWSVTANDHYSMGIVLPNYLQVAEPIQNFSGTPLCFTQINLTWQRLNGCPARNVVLAYNTSNDFGTPTAVYQPGDKIGEGTVIYTGQANEFVHTLPNPGDSAIHFYRIWQVNENDEYSVPLTAIVRTPAALRSLSVTVQGEDRFEISWTKNNCFNGDVLLAYSNDEQFGLPATGDAPGDNLNGGGKVLYVGPANNFTHLSLLPNTRYYYKIWPILGGNLFGRPLRASERTPCTGDIITLPFVDSITLETIDDCKFDTANYRNFTAGPNPALSIVSTGINPNVVPFSGKYMLRFNSYDTRETNETWLTSPALSSAGVASVDVSFKWYEDGSDYNSEFFRNEGVTLQWSINKQTWHTVRADSRIPAFGGDGWKYKQATLPAEAGNQPTLYIRWIFRSAWGFNCYLDQIEVFATRAKPADGNFAKAKAQYFLPSGYTRYYDSLGNALLSLRLANHDVGHVDEALRLGVGGNANAVVIPFANNYVGNTGGWAAMGRYWQILQWNAPTQPVGLRHYYTNADFDALKAVAAQQLQPAIPNLTRQMLNGYTIVTAPGSSINVSPAQGHANIPVANRFGANGFWQYNYGILPDTIRWSDEPTLPAMTYMEYAVQQTGGGGGIGVGSTAGNGALPARWIGITATRSINANQVTWTTGYERGWQQLILERSGPSGSFTTVNTQLPGGGVQGGATYQHTDSDQLPNGRYTYRIKAIDTAGVEIIGPSAEVEVRNVSGVKVAPNPVTGSILTVLSEFEMQWLRLVDLSGRVLMNARPNSNYFQWNAGSLAAGIYYLQVSMQDKISVEKVLVIRR